VSGAPEAPPPADALEQAIALAQHHIEQGDTLRDAVRRAVSATGVRRNEVYDGVVKLLDEKE